MISEMRTMRNSILAVSAILLAVTAPATPTPQEIAAAEPLVQEVMKAETEALRRGKKTREQVGDAAVALAKEAQAPAEKYILLTGAFDYYMRGGAYDKAASALEAVRKAVPDWKGSDEFALIEKAMRSVAFGKGGPVRERYEELKERQQYAIRLKKALEQAKAKPSDKKLQFQVATYSAALDRWPQAVDAFLAANNPACAAAAKLEKESAPPAKIADAWWSVVDIRPAFLSSAIRAHAVDLYKKALDSNSLAGLQKVAAEKRIKEVEDALLPDVQEANKNVSREKQDVYIETPGDCFFAIEGINFIPATDQIEVDFLQSINTVFALGGVTFGVTDAGPVAGIRWGSGAKHSIANSTRNVRHKLIVSPDGLECDGTKMQLLTSPDSGNNKLSPLYLWARDPKGGDCQVKGGKIYSVKISRKGRVISDLRPKNTPRAGLFDKVTNKQYFPVRGNAIFGEDVQAK